MQTILYRFSLLLLILLIPKCFDHKDPQYSFQNTIWVAIGNDVRVRVDKSTNSKIITVLKQGDLVVEHRRSAEITEVNGIKSFWIQGYIFNGMLGWIFAGYLRPLLQKEKLQNPLIKFTTNPKGNPLYLQPSKYFQRSSIPFNTQITIVNQIQTPNGIWNILENGHYYILDTNLADTYSHKSYASKDDFLGAWFLDPKVPDCSYIKIFQNFKFEAKLYSGCESEFCNCKIHYDLYKGTWKIKGRKICFNTSDYSEMDPLPWYANCYWIEDKQLKTDEFNNPFFENLESDIFTNLTRK